MFHAERCTPTNQSSANEKKTSQLPQSSDSLSFTLVTRKWPQCMTKHTVTTMIQVRVLFNDTVNC